MFSIHADFTPYVLVFATPALAGLLAMGTWLVMGDRFRYHHCIVLLGILPLPIFFGVFCAVVPFSPRLQQSSRPFFELFSVIAVWLVPNYLITFIVAACLLILFGRRLPLALQKPSCIFLLLVHALGAAYIYLLSRAD
jgi:hypothetical protein